MTELIRVRNSAYTRYEELLMRRDAARKDAFHYRQEYIRKFGDLILQVFQKKIECIRKKKSIEFCQAFINHGMSIDQNALQEFLKQEMADYQAELDRMVKDNEAANKGKPVTEAEMMQIKRIYRHLVKLIHPDINPATQENKELSDLWHRMIVAYNCNDLKEMQEVEVLEKAVLKKLDLGTPDISIPDIDEKILEIENEIEKIRSTDPYQYRYLLEDSKAVEEKKAELRAELKEYEEYSEQLDEILNGILKKGVKFKWRMN